MFCMENLLDLENVESDNRNSCMLNSTYAYGTREKLYTVLYKWQVKMVDLRWIRCEGGFFIEINIYGECFDHLYYS